MSTVKNLVTNNLDIWLEAVEKKSTRGRGSSNKTKLYGVQKLRELILELAMMGKLVPQDPKAESADIFIKNIERDLCDKISANNLPKLKRDKSVYDPLDYQHEIPRNWKWCELQDIALFLNGKAHEKYVTATEGYVLINSKFVSNSGSIFKYSSERLTPLNKGDVAIVMSDVPNGRALARCYHIEEDNKYTLNQRIGGLITSPQLNKSYFLIALDRNKYLLDYNDGKKQTNLKKVQIMSCPIPIPPQEEQRRIVTKVDELMALCDQLEVQQSDAEQAHRQLVTTLLDTLTNSESPKDFKANWMRIAEHFDTLFTTEESIDGLKQTILQLSVMGKLVPQDPKDEPASVLLEKIVKEKEKLINEGNIKKQKPLPEISEDEKPFDLPEGWAFERLGNLTSKMGSGSTPRGGKNAYVDEGIYFLRSQNVWNGGLKLDDIAYITEETHAKMANTHVYSGDVLLNITGASLGRSTIFPEEIDIANVSQHVTIIRLLEKSMNKFVHLGIMSPLVQNLVWGRQVGMAIEGLSKKVLEKFEFPVPPLVEQHRIVAKVDELMVLCDQLKYQIDQSQKIKVNLADSLVQEAVL